MKINKRDVTMRKRMLIIGASGFLGRKLHAYFSQLQNYVVYGTYFSANEKLIGCSFLDIRDATAVADLFNSLLPNIVLLPGGMTNVDQCELNKELTHAINVVGTKNVVDACKKQGCKLVFYSTDYVFSGKQGNYREDDLPDPVGYYGVTKVEGEEFVKQLSNALICRVALLYGNSFVKKMPFVTWAIRELQAGKSIKAFTDQAGSPTLIDDIAAATAVLLDKKCFGTFHVAGPDCLTRYEMALQIAAVFGFDKKLIIPCTSKDIVQAAKRPANGSLCTEKLKKEGVILHTFREGLEILKEQTIT